MVAGVLGVHPARLKDKVVTRVIQTGGTRASVYRKPLALPEVGVLLQGRCSRL